MLAALVGLRARTVNFEVCMRGPMTARATWILGLAIGWTLSAGHAAAQAAQSAEPAAEMDQAQTEEMARQHFSLGRAQYQNGQFREAASSFEQAYALSKREVLWYNIYLAHRDAGNNEQAAIALRNYLERVPELENRAQLEARLESLDRIVAQDEQRERDEQERAAREKEAAERAEVVQAAETPLQPAQQSQSSRPAPERSIAPYVLMGLGGAMIVGGVVTGAMASSKHSELEEKCGDDGMCDRSLKDLADEGKTLALTADVLLFGGIAAAVGGGVWWLLDSPGDSSGEQAVRAALSCGPRACSGRVAVSF